MSFSINIPGYNRAINVENEKDIFGNETYSSMVRTPFGEIVCIRTYIDEYDYSDLHHNLVWNTRIFMWGSIRDDSDRAFCPGPDEGVLARHRSVSEALGAHIHAVSCLCGCDVSVTEAFELHGEEIVERE